MAALREKKQTIPGVLILSCEVSNLSLLSAKNKHQIKGQYLIYLSACECIIPLFLLVVFRTYESLITCRTDHWFSEILHYWLWVSPMSGGMNIWRTLTPLHSNSQDGKNFRLRWLNLIVEAPIQLLGQRLYDAWCRDWLLIPLCVNHRGRAETHIMSLISC